MRFLVDMALSSGLAAWLVGQGHAAAHASALGAGTGGVLAPERSCGAAVRVRWARLCVVLTR